MSEIAGYVVTNNDGAMCLCAYEDDGIEVLCQGDYATFFPTRRAANKAIERTRAYAEKHKLTAYWDTAYKVYRCEP